MELYKKTKYIKSEYISEKVQQIPTGTVLSGNQILFQPLCFVVAGRKFSCLFNALFICLLNRHYYTFRPMRFIQLILTYK